MPSKNRPEAAELDQAEGWLRPMRQQPEGARKNEFPPLGNCFIENSANQVQPVRGRKNPDQLAKLVTQRPSFRVL